MRPSRLLSGVLILLAAGPALAQGPRPTDRANGFVLLSPPAAVMSSPATGAPVAIGRYGCASDQGDGVRTGTLTGMAVGAITGAILGGDDTDALDGAFWGGITGGALGAIIRPGDAAWRCRDEAVATEVAQRSDPWTNPLRGYATQEPSPLAPRELWQDTLPEAERERRRSGD